MSSMSLTSMPLDQDGSGRGHVLDDKVEALH
jgi:hypothetical protein